MYICIYLYIYQITLLYLLMFVDEQIYFKFIHKLYKPVSSFILFINVLNE